MAHPPNAISEPRPDPAQGVFETILIFEDRPVELEAHLSRLAISVRDLYGMELPNLRDLVRGRARGGGLGRMRLSVEPREGRLNPVVAVAPLDPDNVFPTGRFASTLKALTVDRGYGAYKWSDRGLLTRAEAAAGPGSVPLLVRADGIVLEASRANLFAVRGGRILTPPVDGEILPGVAREQTIEVAEECLFAVTQEELSLADLLGANEVFLTNSLRGVEPVRAIDGVPVVPEGPITTALAAALRTRWFRGAP